MHMRRFAAILALLMSLGVIAWAQSSAGVISGRVVDSSQAVVPGAQVVVTDVNTKQQWKTVSNSQGDFVFPSLQPATYNLTVTAKGFDRFEKDHLILTAFERLSAGTLVLKIGQSTETVTVEANATPVQTASSERSSNLDPQAIQSLPELGRNPMALLQIMPGVTGSADGGSGPLGTESTPNINGGRTDYNNVQIDGSTGSLRGGQHLDTPINLDAIQEVKVLQGNYQAEYGKTSGATIQIVTKSGSSQFHGAAYYYVSNEALNANSWANNRNTDKSGNWDPLPRQRYRYNTIGFNVGGPIYWPGHFNSHKDKLFFFYSQENQPNTTPNSIGYFTVPTAAERNGDFSQTMQSGKLNTPWTIIDPTTNQPFPGNIIPSNRIDPNMQKLMNLFPLPNATDPVANAYNYVISDSERKPVNEESLRVDYAPTYAWHFYARATRNVSSNEGSASTADKFRLGPPLNYKVTAPNGSLDATWVINPTTVNEINLGFARWDENQLIIGGNGISALQKATYGLNLPQAYPQNNPLGLVPALTFSGSNSINNAPNLAYDARFPIQDVQKDFTFSDSLSKVIGTHTMKFGFDWESGSSLQMHNTSPGPFTGGLTFSTGVGSTGDPFADMLLGNFSKYQESISSLNYNPITDVAEWYAQDNWHIKPRLTLDYGVRFTYGLPQKLTQGANFIPGMYNLANASELYLPCMMNGKRVGAPASQVDRSTLTCMPGAATVSANFIGDLVPGASDTGNGMVVAGTKGYPAGLVYGQGVLAAPRLGFSWDVFGDGKTALRGGFGVFYDARNQIGDEGDLTFNPPLVGQLTQIYGNTMTFDPTSGYQGVPNLNHPVELHPHMTAAYNTTLDLQHELGWDTVLDVAYVGNFGRHLNDVRDINAVHEVVNDGGNLALTRFGNVDTTQDQTKNEAFLSDNFFRPYPGIGSIPMRFYDTNSSYHALQVSLNHRFSKNLGFGANYTWSSAMDYADDYNSGLPAYLPASYDYGKANFDVNQHLVLNWVYDLPSFGQSWVAKEALGGWSFSGIASFQSGFPMALSYSAICDPTMKNNTACPAGKSVEITGSGANGRIVMIGNPGQPDAQPGVFFNGAAFAGPTVGTLGGDTGRYALRGPGFQTWDLALFKHFKVTEKTTLTFRAETYNAFNHTNFTGVNTSAQFYYTNNSLGSTPEAGQFNPAFGTYSAAANPRIIQFALHLSF